MKKKLVKLARWIFPKSWADKLAKIYRIARLKVLDVYFGHPSRDLKTIAITGTNGKTTTVNFLNEVLKEAGYRTAMFSTAVIEVANDRKDNELNATIPTTKELLEFFSSAKEAAVDFVLLEVTSHALDQHKIPSLDLEAAVFTNLTQDHLDYHQTMDKYAYAKSKLWRRQPRFSVLNNDDSWFEYFAQFQPREKIVTYGTNKAADLQIKSVKLYKKGSEIVFLAEDDLEPEEFEVATALAGKFNVYNVAAAVATAKLLGIKNRDIQHGIANLESIPGRLERVDNDLGLDIIVDYAHTPDALEKLLEQVQTTSRGQISLVFGACGDRDQAKRPIMGEIAARLADRLFVTDEENYTEDAAQIRRMIIEGIHRLDPEEAKMIEIPDRQLAIEAALEVADTGDTIVVTGMGHEKYRIVDGERLPWNDAEVIKEAVAKIKH